jgi:hypothetical protein
MQPSSFNRTHLTPAIVALGQITVFLCDSYNLRTKHNLLVYGMNGVGSHAWCGLIRESQPIELGDVAVDLEFDLERALVGVFSYRLANEWMMFNLNDPDSLERLQATVDKVADIIFESRYRI